MRCTEWCRSGSNPCSRTGSDRSAVSACARLTHVRPASWKEGAALTLDTTRTSWTTKAEEAIRGLRDVDGATIQLQGDEISEIHVLTHSKRPPKQIVRDVQTVL